MLEVSRSTWISSLLMLLCASSLNAWERMDTVYTYWPNGQLKEEYTIVPDEFNPPGYPWLREGPYTSWYENGQMHVRTGYHRNELEGSYSEWHMNGQLKTEGTYYVFKNGLWTTWNEEGHRVEETDYQCGLKNGAHIGYSGWPSPIIDSSLTFYRDTLHGLCWWRGDAGGGETRVLFFFGKALAVIVENGEERLSLDKPGAYYNPALDLWLEWDAESIEVGKRSEGTRIGKWISWRRGGTAVKEEYQLESEAGE